MHINVELNSPVVFFFLMHISPWLTQCQGGGAINTDPCEVHAHYSLNERSLTSPTTTTPIITTLPSSLCRSFLASVCCTADHASIIGNVTQSKLWRKKKKHPLAHSLRDSSLCLTLRLSHTDRRTHHPPRLIGNSHTEMSYHCFNCYILISVDDFITASFSIPICMLSIVSLLYVKSWKCLLACSLIGIIVASSMIKLACVSRACWHHWLNDLPESSKDNPELALSPSHRKFVNL